MQITIKLPNDIHAILKYQTTLNKTSVQNYVMQLICNDLVVKQPELIKKAEMLQVKK